MNHTEKALMLFQEKYHCSQAVFAAFAPEYGITEEQALKIGGCFGGGMCVGEMCGSVTGALMVLGLKNGQCTTNDLKSRFHTNDLTNAMLERFKLENGSYICRDLLGYDLGIEEEGLIAREKGLFVTFCPRMVESAVKIVEELIKEDESIS